LIHLIPVVDSLQPTELVNRTPKSSAGNEWYLDPDNGMCQVVAALRRRILDSKLIIRPIGATLLNIFGGHDLAAITRMVGPISSVSATAGKLFPTTIMHDVEGKPTDTVLPSPYPDNIAFNGTLADHPGAVVNVFWRTVPITGEKNPNRLLAVIDGDEGVIRFGGDQPLSNLCLYTPDKVYVNNEEVALEDTPISGNIGRNWAEFAKGDKGVYPTWEDAVKVHELVDAIEKSAEKGVRVTVA